MDRSGSWLGGSDFGSLYSLKPYGCARQLWYQKRGEKPDYPQEVSGPMLRGTAMESTVAALYVAATGRKVTHRKSYPRKSREWLRGSPDRRISPLGNGDERDKRGPGILECKTAGQWQFAKFRNEGLPETYVLQIQHYLALTGYKWGAFAILWADNWSFVHFEIERDDALIESMLVAGEKFIRLVENGPAPDRLDASDARCRKCPFRTTCQGDLLTAAADDHLTDEQREKLTVLDSEPELERLFAERDAIKSVSDDASDALDAINDRIKDRMDALGHDAIQVPGFRSYYQHSIQRRMDSVRLRAEKPEIADEYVKHIKVKSLRVYST